MTVIVRQRLSAAKVSLHEHALDVWNHRTFDLSAYRGGDLSGFVQVSIDDGLALPKFLYVGPQSAVARTFSKRFVTNIVGKRGTPDKTYSHSVNGRYSEVTQTGKPALDDIVAKIAGEYYDYSRLIIPVELHEFGVGHATFTVIHRKLRMVEP